MGFPRCYRESIRSAAMDAFADMATLCGVGEKDSVEFNTLLRNSISAILPHLSPGAPAFTIMIPLAWKCDNPVAPGGSFIEGEYSCSMVGITAGLVKRGDEWEAVAFCSRNRSSLRKSYRSTNGAIYIHSGGAKRRLYVFREDYSLETHRHKPERKP